MKLFNNVNTSCYKCFSQLINPRYGRIDLPNKLFKCPECHMKFLEREHLQKHLVIHKLKCPGANLQEHLASQSLECPREVSSRDFLRHHHISHN